MSRRPGGQKLSGLLFVLSQRFVAAALRNQQLLFGSCSPLCKDRHIDEGYSSLISPPPFFSGFAIEVLLFVFCPNIQPLKRRLVADYRTGPISYFAAYGGSHVGIIERPEAGEGRPFLGPRFGLHKSLLHKYSSIV